MNVRNDSIELGAGSGLTCLRNENKYSRESAPFGTSERDEDEIAYLMFCNQAFLRVNVI